MNGGLIIRAFRETWPLTLGLCLVLIVVEALLAFVLPKFGMQMSQAWLRMEWARGIMQAMLGTEVLGRIGPLMFQSVAWVHPVVLALTWGHAVAYCTRVPAGEVDRGTIDVLLGLPVSRWDIYLAESLVWLAWAAAVLAALVTGNRIGNLALPLQFRAPWLPITIIALNFFCLYASVSGFTWLISASSSRRGRAMTVVFVTLAALFLLQYLAQFWAPLAKFAFLSPLQYHRPAQIFASAAWPWRDFATLATFGLAAWLAGGAVFSRRDLCTV